MATDGLPGRPSITKGTAGPLNLVSGVLALALFMGERARAGRGAMEQEPQVPRPKEEGLLFKLALFGVLVLAVLSPFIMIYLIALLVLSLMGSSIGDYF